MSAPRLPPTMRFIERDWLSANGVLFDDGATTALVDSGYVKHREMTLALVRRALGARPLDLLVNTHLHSDHCGGNAILQAHYGVRTLVPAASVDAVSAWDEDALSFASTGQRCERFACDGGLDDGETIELGGLAWRAIAAPGHDPDSLILHCAAERLLISADALWANGFGVIFPELEGESGFTEQRAVLERIEALDVAVVIPGHGPMFTDVRGALRTAHQRLDYLSADPARNARHAVKVLLKYLLLEHEQVPLEGVGALMSSIHLTVNANARYVGMAPEALVEWAIAELLKAGVARIDQDMLVNA